MTGMNEGERSLWIEAPQGGGSAGSPASVVRGGPPGPGVGPDPPSRGAATPEGGGGLM